MKWLIVLKHGKYLADGGAREHACCWVSQCSNPVLRTRHLRRQGVVHRILAITIRPPSYWNYKTMLNFLHVLLEIVHVVERDCQLRGTSSSVDSHGICIYGNMQGPLCPFRNPQASRTLFRENVQYTYNCVTIMIKSPLRATFLWYSDFYSSQMCCCFINVLSVKWSGPTETLLLLKGATHSVMLAQNKNINHILFCTAKEHFQEYPFPEKVGGKTYRGHGCSQKTCSLYRLCSGMTTGCCGGAGRYGLRGLA